MEGKGRRVTRCEVTVVTRGAMSRMVRLVLLLEAFIGLLSVTFRDLYPPHSQKQTKTHTCAKKGTIIRVQKARTLGLKFITG